MALLETQGISVRFGGLLALDGVNLRVETGEIHALIGPNGAGKTTLLNVITRLQDPTSGNLMFRDVPLLRARPHEVIRRGIARTFQNVALFSGMTVLDNVIVGGHICGQTGLLRAALGTPTARREDAWLRDRARTLLSLIGLSHLAGRPAAILTGGQGRLVGLARALTSYPQVVLLDEPAAGLNTDETLALRDLILRIRKEMNVTVLLVEHDMSLIMNVADCITVLDHGRVIVRGTPAQVRLDPRVVEAYLGRRHSRA